MVIIKKLADSAQSPSGFSLISRALKWVSSFTSIRNLNLLFLNFDNRPQPHSRTCSGDGNGGDGFGYLRMVMERLDVICGDVEGDISIEETRLVSEEPRLEELREAFDEYDENRDGFIDAEELKRVLCGLGFEEGVGVEDCKKMIKVADRNGDGVVDFHEFVIFMGSRFGQFF